MNPHHRSRHLLSSLLVATFSALLSTSSLAQEIRLDCGAMQAMASQAYTETRNSILAKDYPSAYRLKNVFWEIEKYGSKCESVRVLGKMLSEKRLGPKDTYSPTTKVSSTAVIDGGSYGVSGSSGTTSGTSGTGSFGSTGATGTTSSSGTSSTSGTSTQSTGH